MQNTESTRETGSSNESWNVRRKSDVNEYGFILDELYTVESQNADVKRILKLNYKLTQCVQVYFSVKNRITTDTISALRC